MEEPVKSTEQTFIYDTDLENEEESDEEERGWQRYKGACQLLQVTPSRRLLTQLHTSSIQLAHRNIGRDGARALAHALKDNKTVEVLNLEDNAIGGDGCLYIADMLKGNRTITYLNMASNRLGTLGARIFGKLLLENHIITHLNLCDNNFRDTDAEYFSKAIEINEGVIHFNLSRNSFSEIGAIHLGKCLGNNNFVENMDLSWNQIRRKGAVAICIGIKKNYCMLSLNLSWNGLGYEGSMGLEKLLGENKYLTEVDVSHCRINWEGAKNVAAGLRHNDTLTLFKIGNNPLTMAGCMDILEAVATDQSLITHLGLDDIPINNRTLYYIETLQKSRQLTVTHGPVLDSQDIIGTANLKDTRGDPVTLLIDYFIDRSIRPYDLFRTFEKSTPQTVSKDHFIMGLKKAKVPLTEDEMLKVAKKLDKDKTGVISYGLLVAGVKKQRKLDLVLQSKQRLAALQLKAAKRRLMTIEQPASRELTQLSMAGSSTRPVSNVSRSRTRTPSAAPGIHSRELTRLQTHFSGQEDLKLPPLSHSKLQKWQTPAEPLTQVARYKHIFSLE